MRTALRVSIGLAAAGIAAAGAAGLVVRSHGPIRAFCGLVRASSGYDPVELRSGTLGCAGAMALIARVEEAAAGATPQTGASCSRGAGASAFELACRSGNSVVWVLERVPVAPEQVTSSGPRLSARLANWEFAFERGVAYAREGNAGWRVVARGRLVCVDAIPQEVLRAWHLRPVSPAGGCYASAARNESTTYS